MRKIYLSLLALTTLCMVPASAQTILEEDFETGNTGSKLTPVTRGEGWTVVNGYTGENATYNWYNYYHDPESTTGPTISGACCAAVDGPINVNTVDGSGPREEILLSPEVSLDDTYQLQFSWRVSPMNAQDNSRYDLQVRIVIGGDLKSAETIFSIQNEQMLRESGVTVFPISTWDLHTSKVDLSDFKGEKVQIAFVYKMMAKSSNIVWLDDISVSKYTPATGPVATVSMNRYDFGKLYVGEKRYSEVITLTNTGKDLLQITGFEMPTGIGTTLDADKVSLRRYESTTFRLYYEAAMATPASGKAVIKTNGGDVVIDFSASKQLVPEGYLFEGFNDYFPPAGWRNSGWRASNQAIEGDQSVVCGGDFSNCTLRSPRLDLSDGGKVIFTYYNLYDGESVPEYDIELQVSYDGGESWTTKWASDYTDGLNQLLTAEVDLGTGSDDSYVRWFYPAVETDDEGAYEHSNFTLDCVLLPNVYGQDDVPGKVTMLSPANNATDIYPRDIVLQWAPAQFAKGYKVYVGTNAEANNLVEAANVGNALSFTIEKADYETTYRWKVVPYNEKGDATGVSTWRFTTQPDASVMEFPWTENFDACEKDVPTGWLSTTDNEYENRRWSPNSLFGYSNTCLYTGWMNAGRQSTLLSPEFNLPAEGKSMSISFFWGDEHPRSLKKDETGLLKKQNVDGGNGISMTTFEILADGEWHQAAWLSENFNDDNDTKYWRQETIDLSQYAGKKVQFRWINKALSGRHNGASLDEIVINGTIEDGVVFNQDNWAAGRVNYGKGVTSGSLFTIRNNGKNALKVKSVSFQTDNFQSDIAAGQQLAAGEGMPFELTFLAKDAAKEVSDVMTIAFEGTDYTATLPVSGEGLAEDVLYYAFEPNALDYDWLTDFTQIDVDRKVNHELGYYLTVVENDGGRYAFTQVTNNNTSLLAAVSGNHTIAAASPADLTAADDWLISKKLRVASADATFDFYARDLGTVNTVFIGDNDLHRVEVLVSETGNTKTADFKTVMEDTEMGYLEENQWHHFNVSLADYVGKDIYVAVRHTTVSANALAFFDDFTFTHVATPDPTAIESLPALLPATRVTVYAADGTVVAKGTAEAALQQAGKGVFVVKTDDGQTLKTIRR